MTRKITLALLLVAAISAAGELRTISRASAVIDKAIPESVRKQFDDDDGRPMKSVSVDLSGDKNSEKLIPNELLCGTGGCPWLVYSPKLHKVIGHLDGNQIDVLSTSNEGYKSIRTYWRLGADESVTALYVFRNGVYKKEK